MWCLQFSWIFFCALFFLTGFLLSQIVAGLSSRGWFRGFHAGKLASAVVDSEDIDSGGALSEIGGLIPDGRVKFERRRIDTISLPGRQRTVFEEMPQVSAAPEAYNLSSRHAVAVVRQCFYAFRRCRRISCRVEIRDENKFIPRVIRCISQRRSPQLCSSKPGKDRRGFCSYISLRSLRLGERE